MVSCEKYYDECKTDSENATNGNTPSIVHDDTLNADIENVKGRDAESWKTESDVATIENQESCTEIAGMNLENIYDKDNLIDDDHSFSDVRDCRAFFWLVGFWVAFVVAVVAYFLTGLFKLDDVEL
ncbi:uncharacterized protein LOC143452317 [Clavelina lepadiformis]|uniref:uncharacterized protein LOC143452317 n=1 Tax=Clavelina lepadiformis TaxID=159417 RepID=UPI0040416343